MTKVSPLAPRAGFPNIAPVDGVRFATVAAGVRYKGRTDVMAAHLAPGTQVAGVFTRSATRSAPVLDCQAKIGIDGDGPALIVVNSGNSNAFTGAAGVTSVQAITAKAAQAFDVPEDRIFTSSTGVIGEPLPHERITAMLDTLAGSLDHGAFEAAARAIMTTDTFPKGAERVVRTPNGNVRIAGFAKGSGMIAPDMATMLVYIFTDAKIGRAALQAMTTAACDRTFNCITVDSDTSTSDTLLVAATGASGVDAEDSTDFAHALEDLMRDLAHQVVRDGEGATKFVTVNVASAATADDARKIALSIANSPLVKTAIAGEDPNWGRVVMAVGKSGAAADRDRLSIRFGDVLVAENGQVHPAYVEADAAAHMKEEEVTITVDLGLGDGAATIWTCDLTARYIEINADYRS